MSMYNQIGSESPTGVANLRINSPVSSSKYERKPYNEQTLIPVTISMILNANVSPNGNGSTTLTDGTDRDLHQVKIVGAIRNIEESSTAITFQVEDGTGLIEVKHWSDEQSNTNGNNLPNVDQYARIIGQIKSYDGGRQVVCYSIRQLSTGNELTHHMLEVIYSAERYKKQITQNKLIPSMSPYSTNVPQMNFNSPLNSKLNRASEAGDVDLHGLVFDYFRTEGGEMNQKWNVLFLWNIIKLIFNFLFMNFRTRSGCRCLKMHRSNERSLYGE